MAINRDRAVSADHFSGQANVQHDRDDGLAAIIREGLIRDGQTALIAVAALTANNGGGVAGLLFTADAADETITLSAAAPNSFVTGDGPFLLAGADLPDGTDNATNYWVRVVSSNKATLHLTKKAALRETATPVAFADAGTGVMSVIAVAQPVALSVNDLAGETTGFTAASFDTSVDTVADAYATLATHINTALALIGAGSIDVGPGADGSGTVALIDATLAANTTDATATTYASAQAAFVELFAAQATLVDAVNVARKAGGLAVLPRASNLVGNVDAVGIAGGGAFTDGVTTDATTIVASALLAEAEAILAGLADNVTLVYDAIVEVAAIAAADGPTRFAG